MRRMILIALTAILMAISSGPVQACPVGECKPELWAETVCDTDACWAEIRIRFHLVNEKTGQPVHLTRNKVASILFQVLTTGPNGETRHLAYGGVKPDSKKFPKDVMWIDDDGLIHLWVEKVEDGENRISVLGFPKKACDSESDTNHCGKSSLCDGLHPETVSVVFGPCEDQCPVPPACVPEVETFIGGVGSENPSNTFPRYEVWQFDIKDCPDNRRDLRHGAELFYRNRATGQEYHKSIPPDSIGINGVFVEPAGQYDVWASFTNQSGQATGTSTKVITITEAEVPPSLASTPICSSGQVIDFPDGSPTGLGQHSIGVTPATSGNIVLHIWLPSGSSAAEGLLVYVAHDGTQAVTYTVTQKGQLGLQASIKTSAGWCKTPRVNVTIQ